MLVDLLQILAQHGGRIVGDLRQAVEPYSATGQTLRSLRFEVKQDGTKATLKVFGREYIMALETGRKPTPQYTKPSVQFVNRIKQYLAAKGQETTFAYAIAKSIHKKGTKGHPGVITNVLNQALYDDISKDIAEQFARQFVTNIVRDNAN